METVELRHVLHIKADWSFDRLILRARTRPESHKALQSSRLHHLWESVDDYQPP